MADGTHIQWTEATWNIINGCSVLSPGCKHCYAMRLAGTRLRHHPSREGLTTETKAGPVWTGETRLYEPWLDQPFAWTRPRDIFVCAHGDLFHESVTYSDLDLVWGTMALNRQHRYQVLTKRSRRQMEYLQRAEADKHIGRIARLCHAMERIERITGRKLGGAPMISTWPLQHIMVGVSIENRDALERGWHLIDTPAAIRWWSVEPLLEDLGPIPREIMPDLIIVGGESGPRYRSMQEAWVRRIIDQCREAGTRFFMKQMAGKAPIPADLMVRDKI